MSSKIFIAIAVLLAGGAGAFGQNAKGVQADPCAAGRATVGEGQEITAPNANKNETLSEHLAQSGGVICPPANVDPDIKAPTPPGGPMPVIPPPGTPQNQPNVQPK